MPLPLIAQLPLFTLASMESLARRLALRLAPGDAITLSGEVGAGKTSFARALIKAIAPAATEVTSPTFTLMQSYDVVLEGGVSEVLWHLDLYRLEESGEVAELGLEELWPHIVLMEWPEIAEHLLPEGRVELTFAYGDNPDTRSIAINGNDAWRQRFVALT